MYGSEKDGFWVHVSVYMWILLFVFPRVLFCISFVTNDTFMKGVLLLTYVMLLTLKDRKQLKKKVLVDYFLCGTLITECLYNTECDYSVSVCLSNTS